MKRFSSAAPAFALVALIAPAAACGGSSGPAAPTAPTPAVDQSFTPGIGTTFNATGPLPRAQTLVVGITGTLTGADVMLAGISSAGAPAQIQSDVALQVRTASPGNCPILENTSIVAACSVPDAVAIANATVPAAMVPPFGSGLAITTSLFRHVDFSPPPPVSSGQAIALVFPSLNPGNLAAFPVVLGASFAACNAPPYARGGFLLSNPSGAVWSLAQCGSMFFRTYIAAR